MEIPIHRIYEQFQRCHRQRLGIRERPRVHLEVRGQIATGEIQVARIISISGINLAATIRSGKDSTCHSNRLRLLIQTEYLRHTNCIITEDTFIHFYFINNKTNIHQLITNLTKRRVFNNEFLQGFSFTEIEQTIAAQCYILHNTITDCNTTYFYITIVQTHKATWNFTDMTSLKGYSTEAIRITYFNEELRLSVTYQIDILPFHSSQRSSKCHFGSRQLRQLTVNHITCQIKSLHICRHSDLTKRIAFSTFESQSYRSYRGRS